MSPRSCSGLVHRVSTVTTRRAPRAASVICMLLKPLGVDVGFGLNAGGRRADGPGGVLVNEIITVLFADLERVHIASQGAGPGGQRGGHPHPSPSQFSAVSPAPRGYGREVHR